MASAKKITAGSTTYDIKAIFLDYVTTAPTAANTDGIKVAVLSSEPATKYAGWLYIITG